MLRAVTHNKINFVFSDGNVMNRDVSLRLLLYDFLYLTSNTSLKIFTNDFNEVHKKNCYYFEECE